MQILVIRYSSVSGDILFGKKDVLQIVIGKLLLEGPGDVPFLGTNKNMFYSVLRVTTTCSHCDPGFLAEGSLDNWSYNDLLKQIYTEVQCINPLYSKAIINTQKKNLSQKDEHSGSARRIR